MRPTKSSKNSESETNSSDVSSSWRIASEGMQLAVTLLVCVAVGYFVDSRKGTSPWFTLIGSMVGIVGGLYNFLKRFLKK